MISADSIARARVDAEDQAARERRVLAYANEINEALRRIDAAKSSGKSEVELYFGNTETSKATRIREALIELSYTCDNVLSCQGDWVNGAGYSFHLSLKVHL